MPLPFFPTWLQFFMLNLLMRYLLSISRRASVGRQVHGVRAALAQASLQHLGLPLRRPLLGRQRAERLQALTWGPGAGSEPSSAYTYEGP